MEYKYQDHAQLPNIIELRDIGQSYDGGRTWVIRDLEFIIEDKPEQGQKRVL